MRTDLNVAFPRLTPTPVTATRATVQRLFNQDLDFHTEASAEMSHDLHAFPAKFPPQLPRAFIRALTSPGEVVLDPMLGSGTTLVEAYAAGRCGLGLDIDPLAVLLSSVKTQPLDLAAAQAAGEAVCQQAEQALQTQVPQLKQALAQHFEPKTQAFVDYWFSAPTQRELLALARAIAAVPDAQIQAFLRLAFSAIIITKSGGVSQAWDLAHTRPHKLKQGVAKTYKPALKEFQKRLQKNLLSLGRLGRPNGQAQVLFANSEMMPLGNATVDLVFTSPPYASNAIDYMRAHKFALVWFGHAVQDLSTLRQQYIGGENTSGFAFEPLPPATAHLTQQITQLDAKKGLVLHRYFSEMSRVLREIHRVLKPGKVAALVVGTSTMRGQDTRTQECLGEIGQTHGLELAGIATRRLDRDRRMMPARHGDKQSLIEERMHEEYVVILIKPTLASATSPIYPLI